ncbi:D-alanyl-D-alanine carboxypeptidase/D-alanyl-D-alanine endopeptidase [Shewanella atlantica]|uniref:D-alanyl-D-alanine carboxypeptidase/D-alanyl-D-alanine-endopeptidase n=1 Tax=Shewanella atlantica TaxID=271099 RepID=A0A431WDM5_9GAMM|nr:D-alanyl-D-alanine carboxypeptidase/D-alanyl-D-alanine-endopeptidase [Shewanella atlantica]RTR33441.1 D-alanyl-D-alanine carboxypeptidase/D-alanyl-D-alanine-endopeptidase [Shewanella atlantica]
MKKLTSALLLCWLASSSVYADEYFNNILPLIKPPHSHTSVIATDLVNDSVIYEENADILLLPASTQKLLTAVAATAALGNDFHYMTEIFSHFPIRKGVIKGDVFIKFSGDPTLSSLELRELFKQLTDQGLFQIEGDLYLVGEKHEELQAPGWVWDDLGICFAAPVSSFIINKNCVHGQLKPKLANNTSQLKFPSYLPIVIDNSAIFDKTSSLEFCNLSLQRLPNNHFNLTGCHPGNRPLKLAIAITEPALFAKNTVAQIAKSSQIKVTGKVLIKDSLPQHRSLIASHKSKALPELLDTMLIKSDNLIADSLLKQIGHKQFNRPGTFSNGSKAMVQILTEEGVDLTHARVVDGSGLSRYNLLSARQLSQVLKLIYADPRFVSLMESLPVAGVSGTLKYKPSFTTAPLQKHIWAKTGSMQGVDNLAGFIKQPKVADTLFVILENGQSPIEKKQQLAPFSALFLQSLMDHKTEPTTPNTTTAQSVTAN